MATVDLTGEIDFEEAISKGLVVVDFWADWCGPCKKFAPIFESVSEEFPDVLFAKVDTEAARPGLIDQLGIRSIPTIMAFRDGEQVFSRAGIMSESAFKAVVDSL